jgi:hypothetical protein
MSCDHLSAGPQIQGYQTKNPEAHEFCQPWAPRLMLFLVKPFA